MEIIVSYITNVRNGLHVGARNQCLGTIEAMRKLYRRKGISVISKEYDISEISALNKALSEQKPNQYHVVIGVENDGVDAFKQLPPKNSSHMGVLIGQEVPADIEKVKDKINLLGVPQHVPDNEIPRGIKCIRTRGVTHIMTREIALSAITEWREKLRIDPNKPVIFAILGGSVNGINYSAEEARHLGEYRARQAESTGATILASNSMRATPEAIQAFNEAIIKGNIAHTTFHTFNNQADNLPFKAIMGL